MSSSSATVSARSITLALCAAASLACTAPFGGDTSRHQEQLDIAEPVSEVSVALGSGKLDLVGADDAKVSLRAEIEGSKNHLRQSVTAGTLTLSLDCVESPCSASIAGTLPRSVALTANSGSGDIRVRGSGGSLALVTGSGLITALELTSAEVSARTGSGDIELNLSAAPEHLRARAGSGDVQLRVPSGSYHVEGSTGSGARRVRGITVDAAAAKLLEVNTGSGNVRIDAH